MRWPRFRVRTLMVAVGVVALLIWGTMMGLRSLDYAMRAKYYRDQARRWRSIAARDRVNPARRARSIAVKWGPQIAEFYAPLVLKYRRAMWRPWRPVAPDPPAPVFR